MRIEFEEIAPRHWTWVLVWRDLRIDAPRTYGSETAAQAAADAFCREVGAATVARL